MDYVHVGIPNSDTGISYSRGIGRGGFHQSYQARCIRVHSNEVLEKVDVILKPAMLRQANRIMSCWVRYDNSSWFATCVTYQCLDPLMPQRLLNPSRAPRRQLCYVLSVFIQCIPRLGLAPLTRLLRFV